MAPLNRRRQSLDTIPDNGVIDESGVQLHPADRKRLENLLGGRFLKMYHDELKSHRQNDFLPSGYDFSKGAPIFPGPLDVFYSFTGKQLVDATRLYEPALLLYPALKTRGELMNVFSSPGDQLDGRVMICDGDICEPDAERQYRSYIVDGMGEMDLFPGDVRMHPYSMRRNRFRKEHAISEVGMMADLYALLSAQFLARGEVLDEETLTFLDAEEEMELLERSGFNLANGEHKRSILFSEDIWPLRGKTPYVPVGRFLNSAPSFEWINEVNCMPDLDLTRARFRRVLGGNLVPVGR